MESLQQMEKLSANGFRKKQLEHIQGILAGY